MQQPQGIFSIFSPRPLLPVQTKFAQLKNRVSPKKTKALGVSTKTKTQQGRDAVAARRAQYAQAAREKGHAFNAMVAYIATKTGLTVDALRAIVDTKLATDLPARKREHVTADPIVARYVHLHSDSAETILEASVAQSVRFLSAGAWGMTATARIPGITMPVVLKFAAAPRNPHCMTAYPLVCASEPFVEGGTGFFAAVREFFFRPVLPPVYQTFDWVGGDDADRERGVYMALSHIEEDGRSPHFLHAYMGSAVVLKMPTTMRTIGTWLQAPPPKVFKFSADVVTQMAVNVLEFGGDIMPNVIEHVIAKFDADQCVQTLRSYMMQLLHALLTMISDPYMMHHNDCHLGNTLGVPTAVTHLHYQLIGYTDASRKTIKWVRYFRVPTCGILCRIMDFGLTTSLQFGPRDHGIMGRFFYGGPMWKRAVSRSFLLDLPIETYDLARALNGFLYISPLLPVKASDIITDDVKRLTATAVATAAAIPDTMSLATAQTFEPVTSEDMDTVAQRKKLDAEVDAFQRAMTDHGVMTAVFVAAATAWGFECISSDCADTFGDKTTYVLEVIAPFGV
jgi:hypothetical protein